MKRATSYTEKREKEKKTYYRGITIRHVKTKILKFILSFKIFFRENK